MRLVFQKNIASSQFTLPFVSIIALLLWLLLPTAEMADIDIHQHGLWSLIPEEVKSGTIGKLVSMTLTAITVYLVAELTNAFVLLRISSRMLSSTFAFFMGITLCLHIVQPAHIVVVFSILSFFALFATYQLPSPVISFVAYLSLSIGSLIFPKLLFFIPIYWICQAYLRSLSLRCFMASALGALVPYWILLGILSCIDGGIMMFVNVFMQLIDLKMPGYHTVHLTDTLIFAYSTVFFLMGMINFAANSYLDKTRTRILYKIIIFHAFATILFITLQPQFAHTLLPLLLVDSALIGGHFISLTYTRFSHIYCLVMLALAVALIIAQIVL